MTEATGFEARTIHRMLEVDHVSFEALLGLATHHEPTSYWDIIKRDNPRKSTGRPPRRVYYI
jgi:hypothetical protein